MSDSSEGVLQIVPEFSQWVTFIEVTRYWYQADVIAKR